MWLANLVHTNVSAAALRSAGRPMSAPVPAQPAGQIAAAPTGKLLVWMPTLQYAGNVLVYGSMHPCDGDWFGGVNVDNAEQFLEGLANVEVSSINSLALAPSTDCLLAQLWIQHAQCPGCQT